MNIILKTFFLVTAVAARSLGSNEDMRQLKQELHQRFQSGKTDSYLAYLYALVLRKSTQIQSKESNSMIVEALKSSIKQSPMNWSSWNLLSNYVSENTKVKFFNTFYIYCFILEKIS